MSTGYGREGLRQVCATLLGARHVPERLCCGLMPTWGAITNVHLYLLLGPPVSDYGTVASCALVTVSKNTEQAQKCFSFVLDDLMEICV